MIFFLMYMYSRCTFLNGCQVVSYPDPNVCKHYAVQYYAHRFWPMNLFWSVRILMLQPELICPICKCFFSPTFPSQFTKSTHNIIWNHKTTKQYHGLQRAPTTSSGTTKPQNSIMIMPSHMITSLPKMFTTLTRNLYVPLQTVVTSAQIYHSG